MVGEHDGAVKQRPVACLPRSGRGTGGVRADQRRSGGGRRLVGPHWLAVAACSACTKKVRGFSWH